MHITNALENATDSAVYTHGRDSELCSFLSSLRCCIEHGRAEAVGLYTYPGIWTLLSSGPNAGGMLLVLFQATDTLPSFVTWHLTVSVISLGK